MDALAIARLVGGHDVRMLQARRHADFVLELLKRLRVVRDGPRQHLDRNDAIHRKLASAIDLAHAAAPDQFFEKVLAQDDTRSRLGRRHDEMRLTGRAWNIVARLDRQLEAAIAAWENNPHVAPAVVIRVSLLAAAWTPRSNPISFSVRHGSEQTLDLEPVPAV